MPQKDVQPPGLIQQASAVPFRRHGEEIELCLITSLKRHNWILPKGIIDPGETYEETALKEAFEEAGLHGHLVGSPIARYRYQKWGTVLEVAVVLMEVTDCDRDWLESDVRQRRWFSASEAVTAPADDQLRDVIRQALKVITG